MSDDNKVVPLHQPDAINDPLTAILRAGARRLLEQAIKAEVERFLTAMGGLKLPDDRDRRESSAAPDRKTPEAAVAGFEKKYAAKYDKAVACLTKARDALLTFFDSPAEHWAHLRTSNPIENRLRHRRHRTIRAKGALSRETARLMVFKLIQAAAKPRAS